MIVHYLSLSQRSRQAAQALAKKLLHTIPAADQGELPRAMREALNVPYMTSRNVIAVRIYDDGADNWRGELVLDSDGGTVQVGQDCGSCEKAFWPPPI